MALSLRLFEQTTKIEGKLDAPPSPAIYGTKTVVLKRTNVHHK